MRDALIVAEGHVTHQGETLVRTGKDNEMSMPQRDNSRTWLTFRLLSPFLRTCPLYEAASRLNTAQGPGLAT